MVPHPQVDEPLLPLGHGQGRMQAVGVGVAVGQQVVEEHAAADAVVQRERLLRFRLGSISYKLQYKLQASSYKPQATS